MKKIMKFLFYLICISKMIKSEDTLSPSLTLTNNESSKETENHQDSILLPVKPEESEKKIIESRNQLALIDNSLIDMNKKEDTKKTKNQLVLKNEDPKNRKLEKFDDLINKIKSRNESELYQYYMANFLLIRKEFFLYGRHYGVNFWNKFREMKNLIKPGAFVFYLRAFMNVVKSKILKVKSRAHLQFIVSKYADKLYVQNCINFEEKEFLVKALTTLLRKHLFQLTGEIDLNFVLEKYQEKVHQCITNGFSSKTFFKFSKDILSKHGLNLQKIYAKYLDNSFFYLKFNRFVRAYFKYNYPDMGVEASKKIRSELLRTKVKRIRFKEKNIIAEAIFLPTFDIKDLSVYKNITSKKIFSRMVELKKYMNMQMMISMRLFNEFFSDYEFKNFKSFKKVFLRVSEFVNKKMPPTINMSLITQMLDEHKMKFNKKDYYKNIFSAISEKFISITSQTASKIFNRFIKSHGLNGKSNKSIFKTIARFKEILIEQHLKRISMKFFTIPKYKISKGLNLNEKKIFKRIKENLIKLEASMNSKVKHKILPNFKKIKIVSLRKIFYKIKSLFLDYKENLSIKLYTKFDGKSDQPMSSKIKEEKKIYNTIKDKYIRLEKENLVKLFGMFQAKTKLSKNIKNLKIFSKMKDNLIELEKIKPGIIKIISKTLKPFESESLSKFKKIFMKLKSKLLSKNESNSTVNLTKYLNKHELKKNKNGNKLFQKIKDKSIELKNMQNNITKFLTTFSKATSLNSLKKFQSTKLFSKMKDNLIKLEKIKPGIIKIISKTFKPFKTESLSKFKKVFNTIKSKLLSKNESNSTVNLTKYLNKHELKKNKNGNKLFQKIKDKSVELKNMKNNITKFLTILSKAKSLNSLKKFQSTKLFSKMKDNLIQFEKLKPGVSKIISKTLKPFKTESLSKFKKVFNTIKEKLDFKDKKKIFNSLVTKELKKNKVFSFLTNTKLFSRLKSSSIILPDFIPNFIKGFQKSFTSFKFPSYKHFKQIFSRYADIWMKYSIIDKSEKIFLVENFLRKKNFSHHEYDFDNFLSMYKIKQTFTCNHLKFLKTNANYFKINQSDIDNFKNDLHKLKMKFIYVMDAKKLAYEKAIMKIMEKFDLQEDFETRLKIKYALINAIKKNILTFNTQKKLIAQNQLFSEGDVINKKTLNKKIDLNSIQTLQLNYNTYVNLDKGYLNKRDQNDQDIILQKNLIQKLTKTQYIELEFAKNLKLLETGLQNKVFFDILSHVQKYKNLDNAQSDFLKFFVNLNSNEFSSDKTNKSSVIYLVKNVFKKYLKINSEEKKLNFVRKILKIAEKLQNSNLKTNWLKKTFFKVLLKQEFSNFKFEKKVVKSSGFLTKNLPNLTLKKTLFKASKSLTELFLKFVKNKYGVKYLKERFEKYFNNKVVLKKTIQKFFEKSESNKKEFFQFMKIYLKKNSIFYKGINSLSKKTLFKKLQYFTSEKKFLKNLKSAAFLTKKNPAYLTLKKTFLKASKSLTELFLKFVKNKYGVKYSKNYFEKYLNNKAVFKKTVQKFFEKSESNKKEFYKFIKLNLKKNSVFYKGTNSLSKKTLLKMLQYFTSEKKFLKNLKPASFLRIDDSLKKNIYLKKTQLKKIINEIHRKILGLYNNNKYFKNDMKRIYKVFKKVLFTEPTNQANREATYNMLINFYNEIIEKYIRNKKKYFSNDFSKKKYLEPPSQDNREGKPNPKSHIICCSCGCNLTTTIGCCGEHIDNNDINFIKKTDIMLNIDPVVKINYFLKSETGEVKEKNRIFLDPSSSSSSSSLSYSSGQNNKKFGKMQYYKTDLKMYDDLNYYNLDNFSSFKTDEKSSADNKEKKSNFFDVNLDIKKIDENDEKEKNNKISHEQIIKEINQFKNGKKTVITRKNKRVYFNNVKNLEKKIDSSFYENFNLNSMEKLI